MLICDTHADTLYALQSEKRDPTQPLSITLDRLIAGSKSDIRVQALALWTGFEGLKGKDVGLIDREMQALEGLEAQGFHQIRTIDEALPGKANYLLTIEGGEVFNGGLQTVEAFALWGVRIAGLVWNNENAFAFPAMGSSPHGLTALGLQLVQRLNANHIAIDISHLNAFGVKDVLSMSKQPIIATHSCCYALCKHPRNLTDDQLKAIFAMDGYVGINFYPDFLHSSGQATIDTVIDHIDHMAQLGGAKHIGMGSDFDGIEAQPVGLEHAGCVYALFARMRERGFSEDAIADFAGENFHHYLAQI